MLRTPSKGIYIGCIARDLSDRHAFMLILRVVE